MRVPILPAGAGARAAGFVAVAALGVAALLHAMRHEPARTAKDAPRADTGDPIAAELMRCRNIGLAAQDDRSCLAAWAENRRRFFGDNHPVIARAHSTDSTPPQQPDR